MKQPRRIMRLPEVITATGYKRSRIYELMNQGAFPKCRRIGQRAVGWDSLEIDAWINAKLGGQQ